MQTLQRPGAPPPTSRGSSDFNLNLTVNSTNVIYVRGFGLDAELGGSIRVEGTTGDPRPIGGFEMRRGRIEVLGQRFDFDRGILTFQGDMDPVLDFAAVTTTADITATVLVTGPARDPEISLSAVPDMPEEEIISRLLFGRSIGSLSAFQTVRLVDAIAEFSGAYGRDGSIFARVRRTVGLDDLDIDQNATGGTTITVGKQISDKVHVGVQTETNGSSRITLDVDLTRNLKAQVEGGANGGGSVGLTFEKEY
jgi:translocation and assembly module TamB